MKDQKIKLDIPADLIKEILIQNTDKIIDAIDFNSLIFDWLNGDRMFKEAQRAIDEQLSEYWPKDQELTYTAIKLLEEFLTICKENYSLDFPDTSSVESLIESVKKELK